MYQNIVYDFDGTISDTYPIFTKALLVLLERHGIKGDYDECYALLKVSDVYPFKRFLMKNSVDIFQKFFCKWEKI